MAGRGFGLRVVFADLPWHLLGFRGRQDVGLGKSLVLAYYFSVLPHRKKERGEGAEKKKEETDHL